jgi:hypothetical protein
VGIIIFLISLANGGSGIAVGSMALVCAIAAAWFMRGFSDLVFDTSSGRIRNLQNLKTSYLEQIHKVATAAIAQS